jgi:hypothetical protein
VSITLFINDSATITAVKCFIVLSLQLLQHQNQKRMNEKRTFLAEKRDIHLIVFNAAAGPFKSCPKEYS